MTPLEIFETKAHYNKWLSQLTENEKDLVLGMLKEAQQDSIPTEHPVKPSCEMERPKLENFLPKDTTTDMVNNMFLENKELYSYINALDNYIDCLESNSV